MHSISCIIIEDEFPAIEILKDYLSNLDNWDLKAIFSNALEGISYLSSHHVDVVFLDIQLPKLSGIDFIKTLNTPPIIIITSAYSEHAIEAFELVVFDYLLKPYSFERFIKTVNRVNNKISKSENHQIEKDYITVKENRASVMLAIDEIIYIESQKEYIKIVCENRIIKPKIGITKFEQKLFEYDFLRIHRSFLVPVSRIDSYTNRYVVIQKKEIPIGRIYQNEVIKYLTQYLKS